jgi:hypothetical protein
MGKEVVPGMRACDYTVEKENQEGGGHGVSA